MKTIKTWLAAICLFACSGAAAQEVELTKGDLSILKGETSINIEMTYEKMAVGDFSKESEYIKKRIEELKSVQALPKEKAQTPAQKAPAKVEANNTVKGVDMVELYNTKTNETKTFARFTWENYMKGKEKDWQLKPTEPEEVQGL